MVRSSEPKKLCAEGVNDNHERSAQAMIEATDATTVAVASAQKSATKSGDQLHEVRLTV